MFKSHEPHIQVIYAKSSQYFDKLGNTPEKNKLPKLTYDEKENLTRPIAIIYVI